MQLLLYQIIYLCLCNYVFKDLQTKDHYTTSRNAIRMEKIYFGFLNHKNKLKFAHEIKLNNSQQLQLFALRFEAIK